MNVARTLVSAAPRLIGALVACILPAQRPPNALVSEAKFPWTVVRDNLLKMAEKMPAEYYSFKPSPEIETFGQRVAHIAGANLRVCQGIIGSRNPQARPSVTSKTELIAALKEASTACDSTFNSTPHRCCRAGKNQLTSRRTVSSRSHTNQTFHPLQHDPALE